MQHQGIYIYIIQLVMPSFAIHGQTIHASS